MNIIKYFLVVLAIIFFTSCTKNTEKESLIKEKNLESQVYEAYEEGMKSLNEGIRALMLWVGINFDIIK